MSLASSRAQGLACSRHSADEWQTHEGFTEEKMDPDFLWSSQCRF